MSPPPFLSYDHHGASASQLVRGRHALSHETNIDPRRELGIELRFVNAFLALEAAFVVGNDGRRQEKSGAPRTWRRKLLTPTGCPNSPQWIATAREVPHLGHPAR